MLRRDSKLRGAAVAFGAGLSGRTLDRRQWGSENDETPCEAGGFDGADDQIRTGDPHLGKVMLYQLSYVRSGGAV